MTMATTTSTRPTRQQFFATETMDYHGYSALGRISHSRTRCSSQEYVLRRRWSCDTLQAAEKERVSGEQGRYMHAVAGHVAQVFAELGAPQKHRERCSAAATLRQNQWPALQQKQSTRSDPLEKFTPTRSDVLHIRAGATPAFKRRL